MRRTAERTRLRAAFKTCKHFNWNRISSPNLSATSYYTLSRNAEGEEDLEEDFEPRLYGVGAVIHTPVNILSFRTAA